MTDLRILARELRFRTQFQKVPLELTQDDYLDIIKYSIRDLYVFTTRGDRFNDGMFTYDSNYTPLEFSEDLSASETEFVIATAEIIFFDRVKTDVNNIIGYSTDALSVTHADQPYKNLDATLTALTEKRRKIYYQLKQYLHLT